MNMIPPGDKPPNSPSNPSVDLNNQRYLTIGLILSQRRAVVRRHRDVGSVHKRRPDVVVFVALVHRLDGGEVSDLLVFVRREDVEFIVVNSDSVVGVMGGDGDLKVGGEEDRGGDVEGVDGGVLESESGFSGLKDCPCDEESEEDEEGEDEESGEEFPEEFFALVFVVGALFDGHGDGCRWW